MWKNNRFFKELGGQAELLNKQKNPIAPRAVRSRFMEFARGAGLCPRFVNEQGSVLFSVDKETRDLIFQAYAVHISKGKASTVEGRYGGALRATKRRGIPAVGIKGARGIVKDRSRQHRRSERYILKGEHLGAFLAELSDKTFGPPGKRKKIGNRSRRGQVLLPLSPHDNGRG